MSDEKHLLFVWTASGYQLVERDGGAPRVGDEVELDGGGRQRVTRLGPSPLPGDSRVCAYTQA